MIRPSMLIEGTEYVKSNGVSVIFKRRERSKFYGDYYLFENAVEQFTYVLSEDDLFDLYPAKHKNKKIIARIEAKPLEPNKFDLRRLYRVWHGKRY